MRPLVLLLAAAALVALVTALLAQAVSRNEAFTVERAACFVGQPQSPRGAPAAAQA